MLFVAADLAPGNSGTPMINGQGAVVGVAFAIAPDRPTTAFALPDEETNAVLAAPRALGAGRCID